MISASTCPPVANPEVIPGVAGMKATVRWDEEYVGRSGEDTRTECFALTMSRDGELVVHFSLALSYRRA